MVGKTLDEQFSNFSTAWHIQKMIIFVSHSEMNRRRFEGIEMGLGEKKLLHFHYITYLWLKKRKISRDILNTEFTKKLQIKLPQTFK